MTHRDVVSTLRFKDAEHHERFVHLRFEYIDDPVQKPDPYRESMAYLIALNDDTYRHRNELYNIEEGCIIPDGLRAEWQTSTSLKVTRLAFNLFTAGSGWCPDDEMHLITPDAIFDSNLAPYFVEAIRLRMYPVFDD